MSRIQELREKRAQIWEQAKQFLDEHRQENGLISEEDNAVYEKTGRASDAYKSAFWGAMRNKVTPSVQNALEIGQDAEGGYLVPDEYERQLIQALEEANVMRRLCHVISTSYGDRKIPVVASHGSAAWMDEEAAFSESDDSFTVDSHFHLTRTCTVLSD